MSSHTATHSSTGHTLLYDNPVLLIVLLVVGIPRSAEAGLPPVGCAMNRIAGAAENSLIKNVGAPLHHPSDRLESLLFLAHCF